MVLFRSKFPSCIHTYNRKRVTNELTWTGTQKPGLPEKLSPVREILDQREDCLMSMVITRTDLQGYFQSRGCWEGKNIERSIQRVTQGWKNSACCLARSVNLPYLDSEINSLVIIQKGRERRIGKRMQKEIDLFELYYT